VRRPVSVADDDADVALPAAVAVDGYRVLQEAVTNAVRHAGTGPVEVLVRRSSAAVTFTVTDHGRSGGPDGCPEGHGIRGMRERVSALGGTLQITGRDPHGWSVRAVLPTGERR
jgi:signal transduction histidine kinase